MRFSNPNAAPISYYCDMTVSDAQTAPISLPTRRADIAAGWRTVLPACLAVIPLGLAFGVFVVQAGLEWWWGPIIAAIVFAGSMEFLLVGLLAVTAPLAQIAVSTLLVNFRHVFYALTFPLHQVKGRAWKAYSTFALTDEAYAMTISPTAKNWSRARIVSIQGFFHLAWVVVVAAGALLGTLIPPQIVGLDFAVTALFVVLGMEAYKVRRSLPVPALAFGCAIIAALVSPPNMLLIATSLFVAALVASFFFAQRRELR